MSNDPKIRNLNTQDSNPASSNMFAPSFNAQTATVKDTLRQVLKDHFKTDTLGGTIFWAATVIEILPPKMIKSDSHFFNWMSLFSGVTEVKQFRVMIDKPHAGLPSLETLPELKDVKNATKEQKAAYIRSKDNASSYKLVYEFNPEDPRNKTLKVGDQVWVMFQNNTELENGFLFSKIMGDGILGTPTVTSTITVEDVKKSPLSVPPDTTKEQNIDPPGFDGRYIVPYDLIVDLMATSKGCPYRYHYFPSIYKKDSVDQDDREASVRQELGIKPLSDEEYEQLVRERPGIAGAFLSSKPWEYNQIGIQCQGFVMRALERLGILGDPNRRIDKPVPGSEELGIGYLRDIFSRAGNRKLHLLGDEVPVGEQLPGDFCLHYGDAAAYCGHMTLCVSYPDKDPPAAKYKNHSIVWGANSVSTNSHKGPWYADCDQWYAGVGANTKAALTEKSIANDVLFKPVYANDMTPVRYYRLKAEFASDSIRVTNRSAWRKYENKNSLSFFNKDLTKQSYAARAYMPPKKVSQHPPSVIEASDLFREKRMLLISQANLEIKL